MSKIFLIFLLFCGSLLADKDWIASDTGKTVFSIQGDTVVTCSDSENRMLMTIKNPNIEDIPEGKAVYIITENSAIIGGSFQNSIWFLDNSGSLIKELREKTGVLITILDFVSLEPLDRMYISALGFSKALDEIYEVN